MYGIRYVQKLFVDLLWRPDLFFIGMRVAAPVKVKDDKVPKIKDVELSQLVLKMEQDAQRATQMRQSRSAAPRQDESAAAAPAPAAAAPANVE